MIIIDGAEGEGGGQILRSSLALSLLTGKPFRIENIRAGRRRPGLMRQHLTAVKAARTICGQAEGPDEVGDKALTFEPGPVRAGHYDFSVGTAGSTGLVLQTVLPALARLAEASTLNLHGGTHNPSAPPFDFIARTFVPVLSRLGPRVNAVLDEPGFYPAGGGHVSYEIQPAPALNPLELCERGEVRVRRVEAMVSMLPVDIARRELDTALRMLEWKPDEGHIRQVERPRGPGNVVIVSVESDNVTETFTSFGEKGVKAEAVASTAAREAGDYIRSGAPVGPHLADQLVLWIALAGGRFRTTAPTPHTRTQFQVVRRFLEVAVQCDERGDGTWEIGV